MSDPDHLLSDLWAADAAPPRDPAFVLSVMEAVERRRFWLGALALVPAAAAASAVLWALGPVVQSALTPLLERAGGPAWSEIAAAAVMGLFLWGWVSEEAPARPS